MAERRVTIDGIPEGGEAGLVLRMAYAAKSLAFHSGVQMQADDAYIRAAQAVAEMWRGRERFPCDLLVSLIAAEFDPAQDVGEARVALLATALPDPSDDLARAVQDNRRILGLSANDSRGGDRG